jgi:hypothetical protein
MGTFASVELSLEVETCTVDIIPERPDHSVALPLRIVSLRVHGDLTESPEKEGFLCDLCEPVSVASVRAVLKSSQN